VTKGASHVIAALASKGGAEMTAFASVIEAQAGDAQGVRLRLLPLGQFKPRDARIASFRIEDEAHGKQVIAASQALAGAQDIPIDYDHQSVYSAVQGVGGTAPAAGWIDPKSLAVENGTSGLGIYGTVKWTSKARDAIRGGEYRYLSPVINHDDTGRVSRLINVGLTNSPAVDGLARLAASIQPSNQDPEMDLTALAAIYGLPADATLAQIEAAAKARQTALSTAEGNLTALRTAAGVAADADHTAALSAVATLKTVSASDQATATLMANMQADIVRLTGERHERIVDDATKAGKILPAQRQDFLDLLKTNEASALSIISKAKAVLTPGQDITTQPEDGKVTALSVEQKAAARAIGVSEEAYLATLKAEAEGAVQ